jgi:murein DD-endopeptidase MepM/ murein hydrolase activator NlpD
LKPTRGPSSSRLSQMPRERRTPLISLAVLVALLGSLMAYQHFTASQQLQQEPADRTEIAGDGLPAGEMPAAAQQPLAAAPDEATPAQAPATPPSLAKPLSGQLKVMQSFGLAYSEAYGDYRLHPGADLRAGAGDTVMAAAAGKVVSVEDDPAEGRVVTLDHGNGLMTRYAGLGPVLAGVNASVQAGNILGQVGQPGPARAKLGSHLHFEVLLNGEPVDPARFLSK